MPIIWDGMVIAFLVFLAIKGGDRKSGKITHD